MIKKENRFRQILNEGLPSLGTRMWGTWPFMIEAVGDTGNYDYVEYVAEYSPFSQEDLENMARAAELHDLALLIKVDFQNRGYVAQKAIASGAQGILFTDCRNASEVAESVRLVKPETEEDGGCFGYPNRRFIGFSPRLTQMEHAKRQREVMLAFMIEKKSSMDEIEEICSVPGVDMLQFGPSDYCMSRGWDLKDHREEARAQERRMIETALRHGIQPRCEIQTPEDAAYYMELGVRHFCLGDELKYLQERWNQDGGRMRAMIRKG
jgi:2-keto-3-deoxy-L-rhamnonate aldolase RhmA